MTYSDFKNSRKDPHLQSTSKPSLVWKLIKGHFTGLALVVLIGVTATPSSTHAQGKVAQVQVPQDAWQVRSERTHAIIKVIRDPNATPAEHAKALREFDATLTAAEKGELTPIETMELFGVFYVPKELQKKSPDVGLLLASIATQATLGWYDALRFADKSGRAEITNNEAFFTLPFDQNAQVFIQFMKSHPSQAAAAVKIGIQYAREKVGANDIHYDTRWAASYGLLRMQCALQNSKTCEKPKPRPVSEWPALFDQAAQRVNSYYRAGEVD